MAERVNFLDQGKYAFTYRNMAMGMGAWVGLCVAVAFGFMAHGWYLDSRVAILKERQKKLDQEQQTQLQLLAVSQSQEQAGTAIQTLTSVFAVTPRWSKALDSLVAARPAQIDLTHVGSRLAENGRREVVFEGYAQNPETMASFVQQLGRQPAFRDVTLNNSQRAEGDQLKFTISGTVQFTGK